MTDQTDDLTVADAEAAGQSGVVDWSELEYLKVLQKPGKVDLCRTLMTLYLSSLPQLFENAKAAAKAADGLTLAKNAHSMKSSSFAIGAVVFGKTCAELEKVGKSNELETAPTLLNRAESEFAATCSAFRNALE